MSKGSVAILLIVVVAGIAFSVWHSRREPPPVVEKWEKIPVSREQKARLQEQLTEALEPVRSRWTGSRFVNEPTTTVSVQSVTKLFSSAASQSAEAHRQQFRAAVDRLRKQPATAPATDP